MAHITKENNKAIREELKKEFPNTKFSVKMNAGNSGVIITVLRQNSKDCDFTGLITDFETMGRLREGGAYRFSENNASGQREYLFNKLKEEAPHRINERIDLFKGEYDIYFTEQQIQFFNKLHEIARYAPVKAGQIEKWADNSDIMTDYFDVTYYVTVKFLRPDVAMV